MIQDIVVWKWKSTFKAARKLRTGISILVLRQLVEGVVNLDPHLQDLLQYIRYLVDVLKGFGLRDLRFRVCLGLCIYRFP